MTYQPGESLPSYIAVESMEPLDYSRFDPRGSGPARPWTFGLHADWRPKNPRIHMKSPYAVFQVPGWPRRHDFRGDLKPELVRHPEGSPGFPVWNPAELGRAAEGRLREIAASTSDGEQRRALRRQLGSLGQFQREQLAPQRFKDLLQGFAAIGADFRRVSGVFSRFNRMGH